MSVPNQTPYIIYNANGLTTVFPFEFYIINAGDIQVSLNGEVITSGYSVTGVGNVGGGDVTFLTPPANGTVVMLERVVPTYRLTDYQDNGDLLADTVNKDFDRLWMAIQRSFVYLGLALRRPLFGGPFNAEGYRISNGGDPVDTQDFATKNYVDNISLVRALRVPESYIKPIPEISLRANKLLAFNSLGEPIAVLPPSGSASDVMIELAKPTGAGLVGYDRNVDYPDGTVGAELNKAKQVRVYATADFGIPDDGSDVSELVNYFVNGNRGKEIIFEGDTYMFAGVELMGTGWEGTTIYFKGKHLLKPDTTGTNTPGYGGFIGLIITKTVNDLTLYYRGDGNRTLQYNREHIFNVAVYGATNLSIPYFKCDEIRGDGLYINSEDQTSSTAQNATNINIGTVLGKNTAVDGRNLISIVSCNRGSIKNFIAENIGGVVGGFQQPGGLDVEPNNLPGCLVRDFVIEDAVSVGAGGVYLVADWNASPAKIQNCHILKASVRGGQKIRMYGCSQSSINGECIGTTGDSAAAAEGNASCTMSVRALTCTTGALIGTQSTNYDCKFTVFARGISNAGVITGGLRRSDLDLDFGDWVAGGNMIGLWFRDLNSVGSLVQEGNRIRIRCPKTANVLRAIQYTPGTAPLTFTGDNILYGSVFTDWPTFDVILGAAGQYLTKEGKMPFLTTAAAVPSNGVWKQGDFVYYSSPSTTNKFLGFYRITTGSGNVAGTNWGTVSFT
nr:MAG TPA: tailspike protein [Caudoviricetes sp.]